MAGLDVERIRALARVQGFEWTDAEIEKLRPLAEAIVATLARLREVDLGPADPSVQFRMF
jgi:Asp-tRNA(Asn)/Glu-tRNA(Gln) amidotransferase C subunit